MDSYLDKSNKCDSEYWNIYNKQDGIQLRLGLLIKREINTIHANIQYGVHFSLSYIFSQRKKIGP